MLSIEELEALRKEEVAKGHHLNAEVLEEVIKEQKARATQSDAGKGE